MSDRDQLPHCRRCELPKDVCACADAREYDRWWKHTGSKAKDTPNDQA
jgi:hypothetical protein